MNRLILPFSILFAFGCGFVIGGRSVDKGANSDFKELLATTILHKHCYDAGSVRALFHGGRIHGPLKDEDHMTAWRNILRCSLIAQDLALSYLERNGKADTTRLKNMRVSVALAKEYDVLASISEPPQGTSAYEYGNTHPLSQTNQSDRKRLVEIFRKYDDEANPDANLKVKKSKE